MSEGTHVFKNIDEFPKLYAIFTFFFLTTFLSYLWNNQNTVFPSGNVSYFIVVF